MSTLGSISLKPSEVWNAATNDISEGSGTKSIETLTNSYLRHDTSGGVPCWRGG